MSTRWFRICLVPVTFAKDQKVGTRLDVNGLAPLPDCPQQGASSDIFVTGHQWHAFGSGRGSNQPVGWIAGILIWELCSEGRDFRGDCLTVTPSISSRTELSTVPYA